MTTARITVRHAINASTLSHHTVNKKAPPSECLEELFLFFEKRSLARLSVRHSGERGGVSPPVHSPQLRGLTPPRSPVSFVAASQRCFDFGELFGCVDPQRFGDRQFGDSEHALALSIQDRRDVG